MRRARLGSLLALTLLGASAAMAAPDGDVLTLEEAAAYLRVEPAELAALAEAGEVPARRIGGSWRLSRAALSSWLAGADAPPPLAADALAGITAQGTDTTVPTDDDPADAAALEEGATTAEPDAAADEQASGEEGEGTASTPVHPAQDAVPIGEAPEAPTAEEVFLRREKVLLGPGEFTVEPGFFYFERQQDVQVFSGGVAVGLGEVTEKAFTADLQTRLGIFEETELLAGISFSDAESDVEFGGEKIDEDSRDEFGDLRVGVRRTLLHEGIGYPDVVLTALGWIPVQEGSYGVGAGLALVKSIDPVALFANFNYRHNFSRDFNDFSRLQPEDVYDVTLGFAYSLNDVVTLSTQVSAVISSKTEFDDVTLPQSEIFFLELGLTTRLARWLYIQPTVAFNLNGDDNRVVVGVRAPFSFLR